MARAKSKGTKEQRFLRCKAKVASQLRAKGQSAKKAKSGSFAICTFSVLKRGQKGK